ncbi:unnamed protein product [Rotaria sordida]|uniref:Uncharacterized protein n=1 Tax=Rotaria sordida TaxID=392033 RepID=A0A815EMF7_9BILA|nr:unnamed protein product [Rotaria sordida]CAF1314440.1 unnamed protein product [Rotaria sordida]CAF4024431.1 unnamed protein product [Rotaria sordida]CAF4079545.1 unnamed protein product [Rotaria sordida]
MSYHNYNNYERMTTEEKDRICDSNDEIITEKIRQRKIIDRCNNNDLQQNDLMMNNNGKQPFKRQLTSSSYYGENVSNEEDNNQFIFVGKYNKRKQRRTGEINEDENNEEDLLIIDQNSATTLNVNVNNGRTFLNSNSKTSNNINRNENTYTRQMNHTCNRNAQEDQNKNKNKYDDTSSDANKNKNNGKMTEMQHINLSEKLNKNAKNKTVENNNSDISISQHALAYAIESHLPPIKISCQPKITQNQKGNEIIKGLIAFIEKNFRQLNKNFHHPVGFEYWYVNKNGDLVCYTKHNELFVYLCEPQNYPTLLSNTNITPSRPRHLPSQHSIVLKFVPNYITKDEIEIEIKTSIKTVYNNEEMKGSMTEKSRHVRIELTSLDEYNSILNNGGITLNGHLIEAYEFLSPPTAVNLLKMQ